MNQRCEALIKDDGDGVLAPVRAARENTGEICGGILKAIGASACKAPGWSSTPWSLGGEYHTAPMRLERPCKAGHHPEWAVLARSSLLVEETARHVH